MPGFLGRGSSNVACSGPDNLSAVFGRPEHPIFRAGLKASAEMCGTDRDAALGVLAQLETLTRPDIS